MRKRKNFRKKPKVNRMEGLQVDVYNNNVEKALKIFKKKVKESGLMLELKKKVKDANLFLDLKKKSYYKKKSEISREKKNLAKLRNKYANQKVEKNY